MEADDGGALVESTGGAARQTHLFRRRCPLTSLGNCSARPTKRKCVGRNGKTQGGGSGRLQAGRQIKSIVCWCQFEGEKIHV